MKAVWMTAMLLGASASAQTDVPAHQQLPVDPPPPPRVDSAPSAASAARSSRVTIGPTGLVFGSVGLEYERAFNADFSASAGLQLHYPALGALLGLYSLGVTPSVALRFFPLDALAPEGLWLGVEVAGFIGRNVLPGGSVDSGAISGLFTGGYSFISNGGFTASVGAGLGIAYTFVGPNSGAVTRGLGPALSVHLNLGYAF